MKHLILSALLLSTCMMQPAYSQQPRVCADRDKMVAELKKKHGETRQSYGLQRNNSVIEVYANTDTGSWTILVSLPTGISCLTAAGEGYEAENVKEGQQS